MRKMILIGIIVSFVLLGCASSSTHTSRSKTVRGVSEGEIGQETKGEVLGAVAETDSVTEMMNQQEAQMRDALADCERAVVKRSGDVLTIVLKTDPGFGAGAAASPPTFVNEIDEIAQIMLAYPKTSIIVEGHTDNTGSETYNLLLSARRANQIKHQFLQRGVPTQRIKVVGAGESRPAATNTTAQGRQMNRRVEIIIQPQS